MALALSAEQRAGLKELLDNLKRGQGLFRRYVLPIYEDDAGDGRRCSAPRWLSSIAAAFFL